MTVLRQAQETALYVQERADEAAKRRTCDALNEAGRRVKAFARLYNSPQHTEAFTIALQVITEIRDTENSR